MAKPFCPDTINYYQIQRDLAVVALKKMQNPGNHLWQRAGWWNCANIMEALLDAKALSETETKAIFDANKNRFRGGYKNSFYDDAMWWALAWLKAYNAYSKPEYLTTAENIFEDVATSWNDNCNGGVQWKINNHYKNAITNELFITLGAKLAQLQTDRERKEYYLNWSLKSWKWLKNSSVINHQHLVNDGLNDGCQNNQGTTWSYNQGVILGGLVDLYKLTKDSTYLLDAMQMAQASMKALSDDNGMLTEPCKRPCGADGVQFKGIYIRYLSPLQDYFNETQIARFISLNANTMWKADRDSENRFDEQWQGSFNQWSGAAQGSALDLLNAATHQFVD